MFRQLITASTFLLAACGGITVQQPKDTTIGATDTATGTGTAVATAAKPAPATATPTATARGTSVDVTVHVHVGAGDDAAAAPEHDVDAFRIEPRARAWQAAKDAAPEGMRLATRSEILAMIDAHAFDDPASPKLDLVVWSATEREPGVAFFVDLSNGQAAASQGTMPLAAVYVKGGTQ